MTEQKEEDREEMTGFTLLSLLAGMTGAVMFLAGLLFINLYLYENYVKISFGSLLLLQGVYVLVISYLLKILHNMSVVEE